jgi:hypothetical protein
MNASMHSDVHSHWGVLDQKTDQRMLYAYQKIMHCFSSQINYRSIKDSASEFLISFDVTCETGACLASLWPNCLR